MQMKKLCKKYRLFLLLILFSIVFQFCSMIFLYSFTGEENARESAIKKYEQVNIQKGDSLWEIAKKYKPQDQTMNKYIAYIKEFNNMKSHKINAGDTIIIPIYKLEE